MLVHWVQSAQCTACQLDGFCEICRDQEEVGVESVWMEIYLQKQEFFQTFQWINIQLTFDRAPAVELVLMHGNLIFSSEIGEQIIKSVIVSNMVRRLSLVSRKK